MPGRLLPCGDRALLVEVDDLDQVLALRELLDDPSARLPGLVDVVAGARTVLLVTDSPQALPPVRARAQQALAALVDDQPVAGVAHRPPSHDRVIEVPVHYDGDDLADVADLTGLSVDEVVAAHTGTPWRVGFAGFAPGFAYLVDGDPRLRVPRRATPRPRVPAGAVGLADGFSGVYPRQSPGGWQLLGHTDLTLWDLEREPPALMGPGLWVRFTDVGKGSASLSEAVLPVRASAPPPASAPLPASVPVSAQGPVPVTTPYALLEVVDVGALCHPQDLGRPGLASMGVSPSGAADRGAHALGARLLGQDSALAGVEVVGGLAVRARGSVTAVVTGALCEVSVGHRAVGTGAPFLLRDGELLRIARPTAGLRAYLGVRGGVAVDAVLGSRSSDTLSGLGPPPVRVGDLLPVGRPTGPVGGELLVDVAPVTAPLTGAVELDVLPGPRLDWLADPAELTTSGWTVAAQSDRVGIRLTGPALDRSATHATAEVPSEGVVRGAVQVPADGVPVVFLADHPVTGGYPVVAVLTQQACDLAAQLVPGQPVRLRLIASPRRS